MALGHVDTIMAIEGVIIMVIAMATTGVTLRVQKRVTGQDNAIVPQTMFIITETAELKIQVTTVDHKPGIKQPLHKAGLPISKTTCIPIKKGMFINRAKMETGSKNLIPGLLSNHQTNLQIHKPGHRTNQQILSPGLHNNKCSEVSSNS